MKRLNFTMDDDTADLLEQLSTQYFHGNKSLTVRAALESLATHAGHAGWVISGYIPSVVQGEEHCHSCAAEYNEGSVLYRPVFRRGNAPDALKSIPNEPWLDCPRCIADRAVA